MLGKLMLHDKGSHLLCKLMYISFDADLLLTAFVIDNCAVQGQGDKQSHKYCSHVQNITG
jgi:hypothetical protein